MQSIVYNIQSDLLKPYVQYILFNQSNTPGNYVISYSNTNCCLGIMNQSKMIEQQTYFSNVSASGIHSYISGMYLKPHRFKTQDQLDEICIDFTPLGFTVFFDFPLQSYILSEDILLEQFGKNSHFEFESIFEEKNLISRGQKLELLLLHYLKPKSFAFIQSALHAMDQNLVFDLDSVIKDISTTPRQLQRKFKSFFGLTPKQYMRIRRFRSTLLKLRSEQGKSLTELSYNDGYADQSHLIKEIQFFTNRTPSKFRKNLTSINEQVFVST